MKITLFHLTLVLGYGLVSSNILVNERTDTVTVSVSITTSSKDASEMSWSLGDDCSGDGYSNDQTSKQKCELTPGLYTLKCMDSEGDGWLEGASITVEWDSVDEVYCDDWDCDGLSVCGDKYEEASFEIAIGEFTTETPVETTESSGYTSLHYAFDGCSTNNADSWRDENDPGYYANSEAIGQVACCSEDGSKCTRYDSNNDCLSGFEDGVSYTWSEAVAMCEELGYRLCASQDELNQCCSAGCQYDNRLVWSNKTPQYYACDADTCDYYEECS